ncbi:MAG: YggT family protein [Propionicimonas sp.]|uniref:YggT family protein n=1 Tax=Propionicimonas sp. TaxID=1955623 RepID=UPI003D0DD431
MGPVLVVIHGLCGAFLALLTLRAVLSLVPLFIRNWEPAGGLRVLSELVLTLTDPPLRALRRVLPVVRLGDLRLDVAFTVLYVVIALLVSWL